MNKLTLLHPHGVWLVCVDGDNAEQLATFGHRTASAALRRLGSIISCRRHNGRKEYRPLYATGKRFYVKAPDGERLSWSELRNRIDLLNCVP